MTCRLAGHRPVLPLRTLLRTLLLLSVLYQPTLHAPHCCLHRRGRHWHSHPGRPLHPRRLPAAPLRAGADQRQQERGAEQHRCQRVPGEGAAWLGMPGGHSWWTCACTPAAAVPACPAPRQKPTLPSPLACNLLLLSPSKSSGPRAPAALPTPKHWGRPCHPRTAPLPHHRPPTGAVARLLAGVRRRRAGCRPLRQHRHRPRHPRAVCDQPARRGLRPHHAAAAGEVRAAACAVTWPVAKRAM